MAEKLCELKKNGQSGGSKYVCTVCFNPFLGICDETTSIMLSDYASHPVTNVAKGAITYSAYTYATAVMTVAGTWYKGTSSDGTPPTIEHVNANASTTISQSNAPSFFVED